MEARTLSLLTHAVGLNMRRFVTQKWHLDAPLSLPRSKVQQRREEASTAPDLWEKKKWLHKTWGIWDTFQTTRVTKEIVSSIMIFFVYFWIIQRELYLHNIFCLLSTSHRVWASCVVLPNTWIWIGRKPCFHFIYHLCLFFRSLMIFNPHLVAHRK